MSGDPGLEGMSPDPDFAELDRHLFPGHTVLVTVTIGRNVGDVPMDAKRWGEFQSDVQGVLHLLPTTAVFGPFTGTGEWEGVREDSTTWTALADLPDGAQPSLWAEAVGDILGGYAKRYDQDAIAFAVGPARLATASPIPVPA